MKKKLFILFIAASLFGKSQSSSKEITYRINNQNSIMANCNTPNGAVNLTTITPPSYAWLQANGYCNNGAYGKNGTVCWTFTPAGDSVNLNSGYGETGCAGVTFSSPTLYSCSPFCVNLGTGTNFTVNNGTCYTWCFNYSAFGGGCSFSSFCPYYLQYVSVLPIELSYFIGFSDKNENSLVWETVTEINNNYFVLDKSFDAENWKQVAIVKGAGNSERVRQYKVLDTHIENDLTYYRLKQVDMNDVCTFFGVIAIHNETSTLKVINKLNVLGQQVNDDYKGVIIIYYNDGGVVKSIKN